MTAPIVSIHRVSASGAVELFAANVPYTSLLWTRRLAQPGEFSLALACPMPVEWPGRYLLTADGADEIGVVEKVDGTWDGTGGSVELSGRFAECLWSRYQLGPGGQTARGANWRQAVTAALSSWHMGDLPPLSMGAGTASPTGSSYALAGGEGDPASEVIYSCTDANGSRPVVGYDRDADQTHLSVRLVDGVDRTRSQSERPWCVFALSLGSADAVAYSGDYSCSCSEVMAHAEKDVDQQTVSVTQTVEVPGFDASTQWAARAYEDVGSLIDQDATPTAALVQQGGRLRAYDHQPALSVDCTVTEAGYREWWDLGDLVEVEVPELSLIASERIEEVRETYDEKGFRLEATVGTKQISKVARAMMGRR